MPKVYAFDVDETLEISNGPVKLCDLMELRVQGHIVGICGNWAGLTLNVSGWQHLVSFIGTYGLTYDQQGKRIDKSGMLQQLRQYIVAEDYVMVGNILGAKNSLGAVCHSADSEAAELAGWRFIKEDDFARGVR